MEDPSKRKFKPIPAFFFVSSGISVPNWGSVQWHKLPKDQSSDAYGSNGETDLANGSAKGYRRPYVHHLKKKQL